jgi:hypothetical protein
MKGKIPLRVICLRAVAGNAAKAPAPETAVSKLLRERGATMVGEKRESVIP